jgi:hypothetical protein
MVADHTGTANLWLARIMAAEWPQALDDASRLAQERTAIR